MSIKKDNIIRKGDKVIILSPEIFYRCGYPLDVVEETDKILKDHAHDIAQFIKPFGANVEPKWSWGGGSYADNYHIRKIAREIAYAKVKSKNFGGHTRKIYTTTMPDYQDEEVVVENIRFVKTGIYVSGSYYSYDGDYDPPVLCNQKTHKILDVSLGPDHFEIEDIHVGKIQNFSSILERTV